MGGEGRTHPPQSVHSLKSNLPFTVNRRKTCVYSIISLGQFSIMTPTYMFTDIWLGCRVGNCINASVQISSQTNLSWEKSQGNLDCRLCKVTKIVCDNSLWFFQLFEDKAFQREVLSQTVKCGNHDKGCTWTGELRSYEVPHFYP